MEKEDKTRVTQDVKKCLDADRTVGTWDKENKSSYVNAESINKFNRLYDTKGKFKRWGPSRVEVPLRIVEKVTHTHTHILPTIQLCQTRHLSGGNIYDQTQPSSSFKESEP